MKILKIFYLKYSNIKKIIKKQMKKKNKFMIEMKIKVEVDVIYFN